MKKIMNIKQEIVTPEKNVIGIKSFDLIYTLASPNNSIFACLRSLPVNYIAK